jgi:hypothetical protein
LPAAYFERNDVTIISETVHYLGLLVIAWSYRGSLELSSKAVDDRIKKSGAHRTQAFRPRKAKSGSLLSISGGGSEENK